MFRVLSAFLVCVACVVLVAQTASMAVAACAGIQITTIQQLQSIGNPQATPPMPLSGNYCLTKDLDASTTTLTAIGSGTSPFVGLLDGQGYIIANINSINQNDGAAGLFGYIGAMGIVQNVGLTDLNVNVGSGFFSGALAGVNVGTITNSYGA
jgi:hypothetical protein